jgi:hypothetical protein
MEVNTSECQPVSVLISQEGIILHSKANFENRVQTEQSVQNWIYWHLNLPVSSIPDIIMKIKSGHACFVCDHGSYKNKQASSAFLSLHDNEVYGGNIVPGSPQCQSAYRGELAGILSIVVLVNDLVKEYGISNGKVTIGCDCTGAIKAALRTGRVTTRWKNFDILFRL